MDILKRVIEKARRASKAVGAVVLAIVVLASSDATAYAYRCVQATCGCKAKNINCASGSCWYDSASSYCTGHDFYPLPMKNTCPVCGRSCVSWSSDAAGNITCHAQVRCHYCDIVNPDDITHAAPPPTYHSLTLEVNNAPGVSSAKLNGSTSGQVVYEDILRGTTKSEVAVPNPSDGTGWEFMGYAEEQDHAVTPKLVYDSKGKGSYIITKDSTLYGRYRRKSYTVVYHLNMPSATPAGKSTALTFGSGNQFSKDGYVYGATSATVNFVDMTSANGTSEWDLAGCPWGVLGYTFAYWKSEGGTRLHNWGDIQRYVGISSDGNYHVYANWEGKSSTVYCYSGDSSTPKWTYTVDYGDSISIPNDSTGNVVTYLNGNGYSVSPSSFTTHRTFQDWRTESASSGLSYANGVVKNNYNGNGEIKLRSSFYTDNFTLPTPNVTGPHVFEGWWTGQYSGGSKIGNGGNVYAPTSSGWIRAIYSALTLNFNAKVRTDSIGATPNGTSDVSWSFGTAHSSVPAVFEIYTSTDGNTWTQRSGNNPENTVQSPEQKTIWTDNGVGTVNYYTAPSTGFYTFETYGAKGADYSGHSGGYGTKITISAFMKKGVTISVCSTGGGSGGTGGAGGNAGYLYIADKPLAIAGGGGGANEFNNGTNAINYNGNGIISDGNGANWGTGNSYGGGGAGVSGGSAGSAIRHYHTDPSGNTSSSISDNATYTSGGGCFQGGGTADCDSTIYWCIWSGGSWGDDSDPNSAGHRELLTCPYCGLVTSAGTEAKPSTSFTPGDYSNTFWDNDVLAYCFWDGDSNSYQAFKSCCAYYNIPLDENDYPINGFGVNNMGVTINGMTHHWYFVCLEKNSNDQYVGSYKISYIGGWLASDSGARAKNTDVGERHYPTGYGQWRKYDCPGSTTAYVRNCGHTSGEIVSSSAATGGTAGVRDRGWSYGGVENFYVVSSNIARNDSSTYSGTYGTVITRPSGQTDYFTDRSMSIPTPDKVGPEKMENSNVKLVEIDENTLSYKFTWSDSRNAGLGEPIKDRGTTYYYMCKAINITTKSLYATTYNKSDSRPGKSEEAVTGVSGCKVVVDRNSSNYAIRDNTSGTWFSVGQSHSVSGNFAGYNDTVYVHIAYKDRAGNWSDPWVMPIRSGDPPPVPYHNCSKTEKPAVEVSGGTSGAYYYDSAAGVYYLNTSNKDNYLSVKTTGKMTFQNCSEDGVHTINSNRYGNNLDKLELKIDGTAYSVGVRNPDVPSKTSAGYVGIADGSGKVEAKSTSVSASSNSDNGTLTWTDRLFVNTESQVSLQASGGYTCNFAGCGKDHYVPGDAIKVAGDKTSPTITFTTDKTTASYSKVFQGEKMSDGLTDNVFYYGMQDGEAVAFTVADNGSGIARISVRAISKTGTEIGSRTYSSRTTSASYDSGVIPGAHVYFVQIWDNVGNYTCVEVHTENDNTPSCIIDNTTSGGNYISDSKTKTTTSDGTVGKENGKRTFYTTAGRNATALWCYDWMPDNVDLNFTAYGDYAGDSGPNAETTTKLYKASYNESTGVFTHSESDLLATGIYALNSAQNRYDETVKYTVSKEGTTYYTIVSTSLRYTTTINIIVRVDKSPVDPTADGKRQVLFSESVEKPTLSEATISDVENAFLTGNFANFNTATFTIGVADKNFTANKTSATDCSGVRRVKLVIINDHDTNDKYEVYMDNIGSVGNVTYPWTYTDKGGSYVNNRDFVSPGGEQNRYTRRYYNVAIDLEEKMPNAISCSYKYYIEDNVGHVTVVDGSRKLSTFDIKAVVRSGQPGTNQYASFNNNFTDETQSRAYFQAGEKGFIEVWTIGYVDRIEFDFADAVGLESAEEIASGLLAEKYRLGVAKITGGEPEISANPGVRVISAQSKFKVNSGRADKNGIPYACHYVFEVDNEGTENTAGWLSDGVNIRIPPNYSMTSAVRRNADGSNMVDSLGRLVHEPEDHTVNVWAEASKNGNWALKKDVGYYTIWDSFLDDLHYRITYEIPGT